MSDLRYWLALNFLPDVGPVLARRLLGEFESPDNIFNMPLGDLMRIEGIGASRARSIAGFNRWDMVRKEIEKAEESGVRLITLNDSGYPEGLKRTAAAPPVLYVRGSLTESDKYAVAVVGSRNATGYGMRVAEKMGRDLALSGLTVVSGMARGIDTASHAGALKVGGRTIAVLGSGVDVPYPASNRSLVKAIESSGAVISEFPFGTRPVKENFPRRNRIISGLSFGVIAVEAALDSGSLITVGYALEQGREVFAVPGNITSTHSKGTNDLIKKGARPVESAEEVIAELGLQLKGVLREEKTRTRPAVSDLTVHEEVIYNCLGNDPKHIDSIVREIDIPSGRALSILLNLELKGMVRQSAGKHFHLN